MKVRLCCIAVAFWSVFASAQIPGSGASAPSASVQVPRLIRFSGIAKDAAGKPLAGVVGITFSLYKDAQGTAPIWIETQNVRPDSSGHYTVLLGSTKSTGMPAELFASGEAQWLGVQPQGEAEQARVLMVSVPYALKAVDADTLGGKPASAFMAAPTSAASGSSDTEAANSASALSGPGPMVSGTGTTDYVPLWLSSTKLGNSKLFQTGGNVGIGTKTPAATLDVDGTVNAATSFNLGSKGFAFGSYSNENAFLGFAGNSKTTGTQNTASGVQSLSSNTTGTGNTPSGWQALFSNTTGSGNSASGAQALFSNTTGNDNLAVGVEALYSNTTGNGNTASGAQTLYSNTKGYANTANGSQALYSNTSGFNNTACGIYSLYSNTSGNYNTGTGVEALYSNTTGGDNTGSGNFALYYNATGNNNTAVGYNAGPDSGSTSLTNATAIGANAIVSESNALVLGGTGSNAVAVGIGTATPQYTLDVHGTGNFTKPITFASNQTFPGTGTVTSVGSGTGLTGGPITTSGTLQIDPTVVPQLNAANTFTGNQTVNGNLSATGIVTGSAFQIGSNLFAFGSFTNQNAFLGFSGNSSTTGTGNTASGYEALQYNTSGSNNTAVGSNAGPDSNSTGLTNATAIGANAIVSQSNALVLGAPGVNVGIGTATPSNVFTIAQGAGPAISDGWNTYSSRRWKTNIQTLHDALGKVEQLRGVSYDLKANGKHEVGVIAEEVGAVVPEIVTWEKNGTDARTINYTRLTALLIEATKEQQALIHQQQEQIKAQQRQMLAQQAQLIRLTSQVKAIQASLQTGETGRTVRRIKTPVGFSSRCGPAVRDPQALPRAAPALRGKAQADDSETFPFLTTAKAPDQRTDLYATPPSAHRRLSLHPESALTIILCPGNGACGLAIPYGSAATVLKARGSANTSCLPSRANSFSCLAE